MSLTSRNELTVFPDVLPLGAVELITFHLVTLPRALLSHCQHSCSENNDRRCSNMKSIQIMRMLL